MIHRKYVKTYRIIQIKVTEKDYNVDKKLFCCSSYFPYNGFVFFFCVAVQIFNFHLILCMKPKQNSFQFLDRENFLFYRNYYWPPLDIIKLHMISYQNKLKNEYSSNQTRWFYLMFNYYYIHLYNKREKNGFVYILKVTTRAYE